MPLSGNERISVAEAFLQCYGEDAYWCGRTISFLGKKGVNILADVQNRALTWQPFLDSGLSIPWWNSEVARYAAGTVD